MEINELLEGLFADIEKKKIGRIVGEKKSDGTYEIVDKEGRVIQRAFRPSERYVVDFADNRTQEGWMQFDTNQDAPYYGVWVNPAKLQTLSYAEGDWSLVTCENKNGTTPNLAVCANSTMKGGLLRELIRIRDK